MITPPRAWLSSKAWSARFKLDRTALLLAIAAIAGVLAALAARQYLKSHAAELEAQARPEVVKLVVAKADLAVGAVLTADVLAVREVPRPWAQSSAVRPDEFPRVDGERLGEPLRAGELLMWSHVEGRPAPTFSARVANGRRAVTVPVDEINSISGLLEPGDRIDVYATLDRAGQRHTLAVLSHVRVLATGQRASEDVGKTDRRLYTTATLDLDPQQARNLLLARESGRITALLRNPGDSAHLPDVPVDLAQWMRPPQVLLPAAPVVHAVPVIYGGKGSSPGSEALALLSRSSPASADLPPRPPSSSQASTEASSATASRAIPTAP